MSNFKNHCSYVEDKYLNGGSFKVDVDAMFGNAGHFLNKTKISKHLDEAISLCKVHSHLLQVNDCDIEDKIHLYQVLSSFYEPIIDDVLIFSAFELIAKAKLLKKRYIVHEVRDCTDDSKFSKKQKTEPLHISTYRKLFKEGHINGIKGITIGGRILLKEKYYEKLNMLNIHKSSIENMRFMRNRLHSVELGYAWGVELEWLEAVRYLKSQTRS